MANHTVAVLGRFFRHLRLVDARNTGDLEEQTAYIYPDENSQAPVAFGLPDGAFAEMLPQLMADGPLVWPDVDPETAAFRLLSIEMLEHVGSGKPIGARGYRLVGGRFVPWD